MDILILLISKNKYYVTVFCYECNTFVVLYFKYKYNNKCNSEKYDSRLVQKFDYKKHKKYFEWLNFLIISPIFYYLLQ